MVEKMKPSKHKRALESSEEADPSQQTIPSAVSARLLNRQTEVEKERQKKVSEANKQLKREKRKQRAKKQKPRQEAGDSASSIKKTSPEYALAYAQQWKEDKTNWKFQTLVQSWILQHLLNDTLVSREDFPLFLEYASSVRGGPRRRLVEEMQAVVEARDRWPSLREEGKTKEEVKETVGRDKPSKRAYRRARSLLQSLVDDAEGE